MGKSPMHVLTFFPWAIFKCCPAKCFPQHHADTLSAILKDDPPNSPQRPRGSLPHSTASFAGVWKNPPRIASSRHVTSALLFWPSLEREAPRAQFLPSPAQPKAQKLLATLVSPPPCWPHFSWPTSLASVPVSQPPQRSRHSSNSAFGAARSIPPDSLPMGKPSSTEPVLTDSQNISIQPGPEAPNRFPWARTTPSLSGSAPRTNSRFPRDVRIFLWLIAREQSRVFLSQAVLVGKFRNKCWRRIGSQTGKK